MPGKLLARRREGPDRSYLVSQGVPIRLPVTPVPGGLSEAEIDALT